MDISPTTATQATGPSGKTADAKPANEMAGDFETFLTLLTTQMRNQDPLKPMESTEFVAQLANFSAVEQQVRTNDRLEQISSLLAGGASDGLAAWIGREVRAPGKVDFSGEAIDVEIAPLADADRAELVVRNDFGQEVARRAVEPGATGHAWDGTGITGEQLPHGRYDFEVEAWRGGDLVQKDPGRVFSRVSEVRFEDGAPMLVLAGGDRVAMGEITGLR